MSGPEHPDTLNVRANIAYFTGAAGDAAGARQAYQDLLPVCERVFGPEHPNTLTVRARIAQWAGAAGDAAGARQAYQDLLPVRERVSGPEHPDTRKVRAALDRFCRQTSAPPDRMVP